MRGRIPAPTSIKIMRGARPCRINDREPVLSAAVVGKPPAWLGRYGCDLWKRMAPVLVGAGLLTVGDVPSFEQLCDEYDTIRRNPTNGGARDRYRRLLVEFGMTPSARSRIKSTMERPKDKMAEFLQGETKKA